jgi:putative pyruvate formate lyase activating enzyme
LAAFEPAYLGLLHSGELQKRAAKTYAHLSRCDVCALKCGVNRHTDKLGVCRTGERAKVSSYGPHLGEEKPISGWKGSGTIFFTRCNLSCLFCQNYDISQTDNGAEVSSEELAHIMLDLQASGCHNINLVSPSHVIPQIMSAVVAAAQAGLHIPLVYNTGGYDSLDMLHLLDGVIDIYMPDMKYADADIARHYSKVPNYPQVNQSVVREMHRQVGDLVMDERGIARRGLLVRHLLLPNNLSGAPEIIRFLIEEISPNTYFNLMDQYHPAYQAACYPELSRPISIREYQPVYELAVRAGLRGLD